eukprot:3030128-Amphidinium_carterae.1
MDRAVFRTDPLLTRCHPKEESEDYNVKKLHAAATEITTIAIPSKLNLNWTVVATILNHCGVM